MKIRDDFPPLSRPAPGEEEVAAVAAGEGIASPPRFPGRSDADVDSACEAVREILPGGRR